MIIQFIQRQNNTILPQQFWKLEIISILPW